MTLNEYRSNEHWKAAIDLGPAIARLADDLPLAEANGLSQTLRLLMVEVPAAVAEDLVVGTKTRQSAILKLVAALELVEKVYPALDTSQPRSAVDALAAKLFSSSFSEGAEPPAPKPKPAEPTAVTVNAGGEIQPTGAPQPAPTPAAQVPVLAQPTTPQENHVQPDSGQ
jgi:hypothetical protein